MEYGLNHSMRGIELPNNNNNNNNNNKNSLLIQPPLIAPRRWDQSRERRLRFGFKKFYTR